MATSSGLVKIEQDIEYEEDNIIYRFVYLFFKLINENIIISQFNSHIICYKIMIKQNLNYRSEDENPQEFDNSQHFETHEEYIQQEEYEDVICEDTVATNPNETWESVVSYTEVEDEEIVEEYDF